MLMIQRYPNTTYTKTIQISKLNQEEEFARMQTMKSITQGNLPVWDVLMVKSRRFDIKSEV